MFNYSYMIPTALPNVPLARWILGDWQVSGVWTGATGAPYTVGYSYQNGGGNINLTGSPNYGARIRVVGDPGAGCNGSDVHRQFNTAAFQGPLTNSVGLESGNEDVRMRVYKKGYTDDIVYAAGGNPYGTSWPAGFPSTMPDDTTLDCARYQGRRLARFAKTLAGQHATV